MYKCHKCKKSIGNCPACKQGIKDQVASLINNFAEVVLVLSIVFIAMEFKMKEQTEILMKPFRMAREETMAGRQVKETKLPKKDSNKANKKSGKNGANSSSQRGKEGDFRVGEWGMLISEVEMNEKAIQIDVRKDPFNLDYLTKIGNFEAVARYMFARSRLSGGCYIVLGQRIEDLQDAKDNSEIKIGEPIPEWIKADFSYYVKQACLDLNTIAAVEQFFNEMHSSLVSQNGAPKSTSLGDEEDAISGKDKIESVIANGNFLRYTWETRRQEVNLYFACFEGFPYFRLEYLANKEG